MCGTGSEVAMTAGSAATAAHFPLMPVLQAVVVSSAEASIHPCGDTWSDTNFPAHGRAAARAAVDKWVEPGNVVGIGTGEVG